MEVTFSGFVQIHETKSTTEFCPQQDKTVNMAYLKCDCFDHALSLV